MFRQSPLAAVLWLLAIALLPVRMANAHVHMCLDGQEPTAIHVEDAPTHHGAVHTQSGHHDVDVDLSAAAAVKKVESIDGIALDVLGTYFLARSLPEPQPVFERIAQSLFEGGPFNLRPPSRAPPALASI